jgi:hypothetical protein
MQTDGEVERNFAFNKIGQILPFDKGSFRLTQSGLSLIRKGAESRTFDMSGGPWLARTRRLNARVRSRLLEAAAISFLLV